MSADEDPSAPPDQARPGEKTTYHIDLRGSVGAQIGDGNTQYNNIGTGELPGADGTALTDLSAPGASPYRGLDPFRERDEAIFFGRETMVDEVLEKMSSRLDETGLLVVSGASGAGKSSLLRAGVLPRVRTAGLAAAPGPDAWQCLLFTPGRDPLGELAVRIAAMAGADAAAVRRGLAADPAGFALTARQAAQARDGSPSPEQAERRLLLVVDQFEQLFTQGADEQEQAAFITALHAAATVRHGSHQTAAVLLVLGMRAEFETRSASYPQLADAIADRYLMMPMTELQLRMAITEPAKKARSAVDEDLVEVLLHEVTQPRSSAAVPGHRTVASAGVLPLLSYALDQSWRRRTGSALKLADYVRTGGIEKAVADSAQRAYDGLTSPQQDVARQVFTQLTATSADGLDTARRAGWAELTEGKQAEGVADVKTVLAAFAAERLLTLAADTVEISHEALLTAWPLLRDTWLAETHADRVVRTQLRNVAADWEANDRSDDYLYRGSLLEIARVTAGRIEADPARHPPLSEVERDFLRASTRAREDAQRAVEDAQRARELARQRRLRVLRGTIALLTVLVVGFAVVAVIAVRARQEAVRESAAAASGQLYSQSQVLGDTNPVLAKLESLAAWRIDPTAQARYAMLAATRLPGIAVLNGDGQRPVDAVAFSPDGKTLDTTSMVRPAEETGYLPGAVQRWDLAQRRQISSLLPGGNVTGWDSVAFSAGGQIMAALVPGSVELWNLATGVDFRSIAVPGPSSSNVFEELGSTTKEVALSSDGTTLATLESDDVVKFWAVATGRQTGTMVTDGGDGVSAVAFSPRGNTLAVITSDAVQLWDTATGKRVSTLPTGSLSAVDSIAFSRNGAIVAAGSFDGAVQLWDVATGQPVGIPLTGGSTPVDSLTFSPDDQTLATGSDDGTIRLWNLAVASNAPASLLAAPRAGSVDSVAYRPGSAILAAASADGTVRVWNAASEKVSATLAAAGTVVSFSPQGQTLVSSSSGGPVRLWDGDADWSSRTLPLSAATTGLTSAAFSPNGSTLATDSSGTVGLWDVSTGRLINTLPGDTAQSDLVMFGSGGKTLVLVGGTGIVQLWDVATRYPSLVASPGIAITGIMSAALSPDGRTLATGTYDGTTELWDVATGHQLAALPADDTEEIGSVAFSPDGQTLATASNDGEVRLWDVATGQQIGAPLNAHAGAAHAVTFSSDGKTLAVGSANGTVQLWDVSYLTDPGSYLCASAGQSLTPAQWSQDVPAGPAYQNICPQGGPHL